MKNIREAMLKINEMNAKGEFTCPVHLALGHEAIAEAVDEVMTKDDVLLCTHRNIHYNIARADNLDYIINEMKNGEGCMNMTNVEKGIVYTSSILGNNLSVACGYALAKKIKGEEGVVFVVTGDGAIEEGAFWEALIFAKSQELAIVFLVENNGWSMSTKVEERRCSVNLDSFGSMMAIPKNHIHHTFEKYRYVYEVAETKKYALSKGPVILEVILSTLGGYEKENRFINYHSGVVKHEI